MRTTCKLLRKTSGSLRRPRSVEAYLLTPSLEKKTVYVWMLPLASAGGRQLRRTNRLETKTGTTSRGAEGRTLELGTAGGEGEESVREVVGGAAVVAPEVLRNKGPRRRGRSVNKMTGDEREREKKNTNSKITP